MKAQQLKNAILQLAIQGKLVPQDPNDEPASELLCKIQAEKDRLITEGKIKKSKKATDKAPYTIEPPFEIPESWEWVRLKDIAELINGDRGKNYPSKDKLHNSGIPFISAINLEDGAISKDKLLYLSQEQYDLLGSGKLKLNDIIFCLRGSLGKNGIYPFDNGAIASSLVIIRLFSLNLFSLSYFSLYINSPIINEEINKYNNGTAQPNLSAGNLGNFLFPLPPLPEQHRIVQKIEELLPLVEQYDKTEQKLTALNTNFPEQLKKSVLQAAIQGKLTEQDPNDEPAFALIERIKAEKNRLIAEKKLKKPKSISEIVMRDNLPYEIKDGVERCIADEVPFDIPENWCWVRLENITAKITDGSHNPPPNRGSGIPILSAANIFNHQIQYNSASRWVSESDWNFENKRTEIELNDVLITIVGTIGRTAIVRSNDKFALQRSVAVLKPIYIYSDYLSYILQSPYVIDFMNSNSKGTAQKGIYLNTLKTLLLPLPPINEQHRIVQKIELLFSELEKLS